MLGVNLDPTYLEAAPPPNYLRDLGLRWVRLVSKSHPDTLRYVESCNELDLAVLAVVARESEGYLVPGAAVYQIGNEPDLTSPSSWSRTPAEYVQDWNIYRDTYPDVPMIGAGLASGNAGWLRQVWAIQRLHGCGGVAIHPYTKSPQGALALVNSYKSIVGPTMPIWITEWNNPLPEVGYFKALMASAGVPVLIWFPWTSIMNDSLAGLRENDTLRRVLTA